MPEPLLLRDAELAALLGASRATVHAWRAAGKIPPALKIGGAVRWRRDEIVAWLEAGAPSAELWAARRAMDSRRANRA